MGVSDAAQRSRFLKEVEKLTGVSRSNQEVLSQRGARAFALFAA